MTEQTSSESDKQQRDRAETRASKSLGRRIAIGLYWVCALYVAGVGFWSIPKQIFFTEHVAPAPAGTCTQGIRTLRDELVDRLTQVEREPAVVRGPIAIVESIDEPRRFFRDWDHRFHSYERTCEREAPEAYSALERLRYRVETDLVRHDRETRPLLRDIALALPAEGSVR